MMRTEELIKEIYDPFITTEKMLFLFNEMVRMACQQRPQEILINIRGVLHG